jgi:hypothetical protein
MSHYITTIAGIPCVVDVTSFNRGTPARVNAEPDYCDEGEPPEIEFEVLDSRCRPAPWLANKMSDDDAARIERELLASDLSYNADKRTWHQRNEAQALALQIRTQDMGARA